MHNIGRTLLDKTALLSYLLHEAETAQRFITSLTRARHLSLSWVRSIQCISLHPASQRFISILSSHLHLGLQVVCLPQDFPPKPCMSLSSLPYMLHSLPISFFLIWSPEWYLVRFTKHKASRYVVFSTPLLPRPSQVQISFSASYSRKPSAYVPPSVWATKFYTRINKQAKL